MYLCMDDQWPMVFLAIENYSSFFSDVVHQWSQKRKKERNFLGKKTTK